MMIGDDSPAREVIRSWFELLSNEEKLSLVRASLALDYAALQGHLMQLNMVPRSADDAARKMVAVIEGLDLPQQDRAQLRYDLFGALGLVQWMGEHRDQFRQLALDLVQPLEPVAELDRGR